MIECYRYHKFGHYQNEYCLTWEEGANYVEFDEYQEVLLMAQEKLVSNYSKDEGGKLVDATEYR
jgi:hypothetical protein